MLNFLKVSALAFVCSGATALAALSPRAGEEVIVVFAPWVEEQSVSERIWLSGGFTTADLPVGVRAAGGGSHFISNLRWNGALLVLSAQRASVLCGPRSVQPAAREAMS